MHTLKRVQEIVFQTRARVELFKSQTISRKSKDPINLNDSQRSSYGNQHNFDEIFANKFKPI